MQNDKTTLRDLSVFTSDGSAGVFDLINRTATQAGADALRKIIRQPPESYQGLVELQDAVKFWTAHSERWPKSISNGTLVMLEKFFEAADNISAPPTGLTLAVDGIFKKLFNRQEYFYIQFSLSHLSDFLKGCSQLADMLGIAGVPPLMQRELEQMKELLQHRFTGEIMAIDKHTGYAHLSHLNYCARREMKTMVYRLMAGYARLDAWHSMAMATQEHRWVMPEILPDLPVCFEARGLAHPLVDRAVAYDLSLNTDHNFLLLTGANMSGKTTLMRAMGVSALLAHVGMGVPAASLRLSFLGGIITNMQVEDNILRGESYFFAEVQRMKLTAEKLQQQRPHLVLMDELFKGTNVHDACECTRAVIEGLMHFPHHLMVLSTHLYEVAQQFIEERKISFAYFVTELGREGNYQFTYELKEGISNDRIGYLILQKEGVIDLLNRN